MVRRSLGYIVAILTIGVILAVISGWLTVITVGGESMEPTYYTGDVVLATRAAPEEGDVIIYSSEYAHTGGTVIHRIVDIAEDGTITTQGDNNDEVDPPVSPDAVQGVARAHIPEIGNYLRNPISFGVVTTTAFLVMFWPANSTTKEGDPEE